MNKKIIFTAIVLIILVFVGQHYYFDPNIEEVRHNSKAMFQGKIAKAFKVFQKKASIDPRLAKLVELKDTFPIKHSKGWATLSLFIAEKDLYSEVGIFNQVERRGPLWERPIYFSYFDNNQLITETFAGMRIHGGKSRSSSLEAVNSFRIYLRKRYGENKMPKVFDPSGEGLSFRRFVVHHDEPIQKKFINDFAYYLTRFWGGDAPHTKPVKVYINGKVRGYYYICEHQSEKHLKLKYKSHNMSYYRLKADNDRNSRIEFKKLMTYIKHTPSPIQLQELEKILDIDSYIRSVFPIIFLGVTDYDQGVVYRLKDHEDKRWKYLNWDMDHAFYDIKKRAPQDEAWKKEGIALLMERDGSTLRSKIFRRLIKESPEFKEKFKRFSFEALEKLKPEIWKTRIHYYRTLLQEVGLENEQHLNFLDNWIAKRKEFIKKEIELL